MDNRGGAIASVIDVLCCVFCCCCCFSRRIESLLLSLLFLLLLLVSSVQRMGERKIGDEKDVMLMCCVL